MCYFDTLTLLDDSPSSSSAFFCHATHRTSAGCGKESMMASLLPGCCWRPSSPPSRPTRQAKAELHPDSKYAEARRPRGRSLSLERDGKDGGQQNLAMLSGSTLPEAEAEAEARTTTPSAKATRKALPPQSSFLPPSSQTTSVTGTERQTIKRGGGIEGSPQLCQ